MLHQTSTSCRSTRRWPFGSNRSQNHRRDRHFFPRKLTGATYNNARSRPCHNIYSVRRTPYICVRRRGPKKKHENIKATQSAITPTLKYITVDSHPPAPLREPLLQLQPTRPPEKTARSPGHPGAPTPAALVAAFSICSPRRAPVLGERHEVISVVGGELLLDNHRLQRHRESYLRSKSRIFAREKLNGYKKNISKLVYAGLLQRT